MWQLYEFAPELVVQVIRKHEEGVRRLLYGERMRHRIRNINLRLVKAAPTPRMQQEIDGVEGLVDAQIVFEYDMKMNNGKWESMSVLYQQIPTTREAFDDHYQASLEAGCQVIEQIRSFHKEGKPLHFWDAKTLQGQVERVWVDNDQFAFAFALEDGTSEIRSYVASFSASSSLRSVLQAVDPKFTLSVRMDLNALVGKPFEVVVYTDRDGRRRLYEFQPCGA